MPTLADTRTLPKNEAVSANDVLAITRVASQAYSQVEQVPAALIGLGFTHAWVINYNNAELAAQDSADTDEEIKLIDIPANSIITKAMVIVTEAFTNSTALDIILGRTGDTNGYIETTSLLAKTAKLNIAGDEIDAFGEIDIVTASDKDLLLTFDNGTNGDDLQGLTAGQLVVLVAMPNIDDFKDIVPAT